METLCSETPTTTLGKVKKKTNERKRPYSVNLMHRLFEREHNFDRFINLTHISTPATHMRYELEMFKCFTPNFTIQNVDKPPGFVRKFTPNGRALISFSLDQRSLEIYEYRGVGALADLLDGQQSECITAADHSQQSLRIRQDAFERMFSLRRSIRMKYGITGGYLNREFSIFIDGSRYVLIASMGIAQTMPDVRDAYNYPDLYSDCDHFFYNFYLIDLLGDYLSDCVTYKYDSIQLSHNHGVSECGKKVAIFSKYRQCIDLYEVDDGCLKKLYTIGAWGAQLAREPSELLATSGSFWPNFTRPFSHFKQRFITFLYRQVIKEENLELRQEKLKNFYKNFAKYERMVIAKMQLFSPGTLLIRYEQHPQQTDNVQTATTTAEGAGDSYPLKLYVFYRIQAEKIINIYEGTSTALLYLLRDHCDFFRNVRSLQTGRRPSSSSNNVHLLASFNETVSLLSEPEQRLNITLPISTQSFSASPYLDYNLFMYDDRQISALERPRFSSMESLEFRDRITERCLFRLNLEPDDGQFYFRELIAFIYHPYEPFIISVKKLSQQYVVNFHIYNKSTIVKQ